MGMDFYEKKALKDFFNCGGFILDFNDSEFDLFTKEIVGISLKKEYELSKGKSFGKFVDEQSDDKVIRLCTSLLEYYDRLSPDSYYKAENDRLEKYDEVKNIIEKYSLDKISEVHSYNSEYILFKFNSEYIESQLGLIIKEIEDSPRIAIGKSKELLESCFKYILDELSIEYKKSATIGDLRTEVFKVLDLNANHNQHSKSNKEVKKILNSLSQIVDGISTLRNDKGDGHGKGSDFKELPPRYAWLVVNATATIVRFIWETYEYKNPLIEK
ncbi:abortive infection family protein [Vagococcus sp. PNs007]|uniref:Abortive infection family protein n=1 Tax=Vagococcus proximus TaxID=2991417 RepID=A0ABT5WYX9_9ENTE|nr:abortive infection family protein [Vagococcus proximus]MDF0478960.1 abortive infection family protein [Vagococcus proximus]